MLKKRDAIILAVDARLRKTTHRYGVEIPKSVEHTHELDRKNGNTLWRDAILKEMKNVGVAFEILPQGKKAPSGWFKASGHLIFNVKMSLQRKARWVLNGHKQPSVEYSTYAGVVSRETIQIAFTYAALNGLDVWATSKLHRLGRITSFVAVSLALKTWVKPLLLVELYMEVTAGRDYQNHLREFMSEQLKFTSCKADPDL